MRALPPPLRLLHDGLLASAARLPDKVAVVVEGKPYTYAQLLDGAARMANAMQARGVQRGDRVAIFMENSWSCIVSIYAALMAGSVFFVINPQTKSDKLQYILDDSGAKLLLAEGQALFDQIGAHLAGVEGMGRAPEGQRVSDWCHGQGLSSGVHPASAGHCRCCQTVDRADTSDQIFSCAGCRP